MAAPRRPRGEEEEKDEGLPLEAKRLRGQRRLLVVLEGASLETVKVGKTFELLNCDKHKAMLLRIGRDPGEVRPDITHQSLLMLMDSPLNRAGLLQVYIHTQKNVLIEVNPQTRIPRTFDRFCGLMVQLLHKLSVRAADGPQKLLKSIFQIHTEAGNIWTHLLGFVLFLCLGILTMLLPKVYFVAPLQEKVIKNPVSDHLPVGCMKIGTSFAVSKVTDLRELVPAAEPVAIVVGAFAHGSVNVDYTEKMVSISNYPLSAALTCAKITTAFEEVWGVV
ncbi:Ribosomal RNA small subunit methyltransferase NEP1 [Pitangus sulphuratus]|nr:Ribosomal RNA small subunit methyltransferase NEP1 [Pitangus sulphuratus]